MLSSPIRRDTVLLGVGQTVAFASSFYLPSVLAPAMAKDTGLASSSVFALLSMALLIGSGVGVFTGRIVDRLGGRPVLQAACWLFAAGLALLALATNWVGVLAAWIVIGFAMGAGLYDTAFAGLVRLHGQAARNAITGVTLIAGFASTVGWPITLALESTYGWRGACWAWAGLHLLLVLPLYSLLARAQPVAVASSLAAQAVDAAKAERATGAVESEASRPPASVPPASESDRRHTFIWLAIVFTCTGFLGSSIATLLPQILQSTGLSAAQAVGFAALMGPAQVAGRVLEFGVMRKVHPLWSARIAAATHPVAAASLLIAGPIAAPLAAPVFAIVHGAGNGMITVVKGTLPLALFGAQGYGRRQGLLLMPAKVAGSLAPFAFGLALTAWGSSALWLSAAIGCVASFGFWRLRAS